MKSLVQYRKMEVKWLNKWKKKGSIPAEKISILKAGKLSKEIFKEERGKKMKNLNDLLAKDKQAKQFFLTLPENVQGSLIQHTNDIHNTDELYYHANEQLSHFE